MSTTESVSPAQDPIKHVVFLLLENHSFDQMLGCLQSVYPELDGIDDAARSNRGNRDAAGNVYYPQPTDERQMASDPHHELPDVHEQLADGNGGFVRNFALAYPASSTAERQQIMSYYPLDFLPALHGLAREFTVCDRWHASVPGPTWPNRFFALSGTASGRVKMPQGVRQPELENALFNQDQDTLFDRLSERGKSWRVYFYDFPCSLLLKKLRQPQNLANYETINHFFDAAQNEAGFPEFCFIEPKYFGADQNDDHPPHNVMKSEKLIADVYNAIRGNPELWNSTLLVVLFDEHGGFYDHVPPPPTVPPDAHREEYSFDQLGVRVPALLVSPWVGRRVEKTLFDHTSFLKYLIDKWGLGPLGDRAAQANSIAVAFSEATPRTDTISFIRVPYSDLVPAKPELEKEDASDHQKALRLFAAYLQDQPSWLTGKAMGRIAERAGRWSRMKAALGKQFIKAGTRLTSGLEEHNEKRVEAITSLVLNGLRAAKKD